jgi:serine/threonine-protein kinase
MNSPADRPRRIERIGPYRIEERLGAGGMGEVYQAYDERLDRRVAVKLIRPESSASDTARERFRREARAAAGLSHPSVVQIHDILDSGEGDAIVMEYVEGTSLAHLLRRGSLGLPRALRLARQIAEGLAAAHARGIVHRDLKAENVMVTETDHAKILDFGLAKRLATGAEEPSLTEVHAIVGTSRSMSPEQAQGLPVDHRSDLFSLGTLLYEMLAGRSPFLGTTPLETMTRVCSFQPQPLTDLDPRISQRASDLVGRLLEKDPARRPQSAREVLAELERLGSLEPVTAAGAGDTADTGETLVEAPDQRTATPAAPGPDAAAGVPWRRRWVLALTLGLAVAAGLAVWLLGRGTSEPLYVAVPKPEVRSNADGAAMLASGVRMALLRGLLSFEGVSPLAPELVDAVSGSPVDVARATAADEVLTARLDCAAETCQVALGRIRGQEGTLLWTQSFTAPRDRPYLLPEAVLGHLRQGYPERAFDERVAKLEVRPADYAEYLRLYESFDTRREEDLSADTLLRRLAALRASSPRFLEAYLFEAYVLDYRFRSRRDPADLERGFEVLGQARRLAPEDPRPLPGLFDVALLEGDLDRAADLLRDLERLQPGDAQVFARRARLLERRGETAAALASIRSAVRLQPSWKHLFWAADMEYRQGRMREAREHLQELLRRFPQHYPGTSLLAQLELFYGDPQRAVALYSGLVRRSPQYDEISNLGNAYLVLGRYPAAESWYRRAVALQPRNPLSLLNLADVVLLQGRKREAEGLYREVLRLAESDPAASSDWQLSSVRGQALAHLGRSRDAVEAVQRALLLAPSNPQTAWEAALVYVLVGDRTSALFNAERALEQGAEPGWFKLPWFEPLRERPDFAALLARSRE